MKLYLQVENLNLSAGDDGMTGDAVCSLHKAN